MFGQVGTSTLCKIIESCKYDYKQRIDDKESRIYDLTKKVENLAKEITLLYQTNKKLESEKAELSHKLQEFKVGICQTETQFPIKVIDNKS